MTRFKEILPKVLPTGAALLLFFGNILLAYVALKLYDEPLRRRLAKRFLHRPAR